ncbi:5'-nucleotidase [Arcanobacterium wilhelmae]|uniref:5'-nucleotidase n=1 Tax=Arcanobacterium wilhelmae TaxID=1803177 RepID=A0ABT9NAK2_9ACTO|nr:5'-nucleotidase C-terminal domain-containing protein [Arcanobacterium wilhelmae]MDP9800739.1 5'-nucleotidase [Arcanobacterium wilhelmae]WFN90137.1 5'-nucleotidase C-terminal domain-containing protein [Arcanobacterium wilhelmae]
MKKVNLRRPVGAAAALALTSIGFGAAATPAFAADGDVSLDFAVISDFHGHIENAAALDYQIDQMRTANPNTRFLSVGDNVGGSAYISAVDNDTPTINILKAMGLDYSASGNHEFDKGYSDLKDRILPGLAPTPIQAANAKGADAINKPYELVEIGGVKVAYIGTVTDEMTTLVSPSAIAGITFEDPVAITNTIADQLKDGDAANGEADVVIALMHKDRELGPQKLNKNVDLAFGGHSHIEGVGKTASGAPVCEPINYGMAFIKANVTKKADGTITASCAVAELPKHEVANPKDPKKPLKVFDNESPDIKAMFEAASEKAKELGATPVGYIDRDALRGSRTGADAPGSNRGTESPANNLLADAFYQFGQTLKDKPDLGVMNPGGVRADFRYAANTELTPTDKDGLVTQGESNTVQPFGNVFGTIEITGAQLYTLLEQQWKDPSASHPVLRLGLSKNVVYTYDPTAEQGKHITEIFVNGEKVANDDSRTYRLASNTFVLEGGDGFTVLKEGKNFIDTGMIDNVAFNDYLKNFTADKPLHVDYTQRSVGVAPYTTEVKAGEELVFDLSSLAMTAGEKAPKAVTVTVAHGDVTVSGTATVDATPNAEGYDETGMAIVGVKLPADFPGGVATVIVTADDGTESGDVTEVALPSLNVEGAAAPAPQPEPQLKVVAPVFPKSTVPESGRPYLTIPKVEGVQYLINGTAVEPGEYLFNFGETQEVTAKALEGYVLDEKVASSWKFTEKAPKVKKSDPSKDPKHKPSGQSATPNANPNHAGQLSYTGANVAGLAVVGGVLLLAGAVATVKRRRD